jgi:dipeptidyl aminopeptidase/acylaminoacyl peptidase
MMINKLVFLFIIALCIGCSSPKLESGQGFSNKEKKLSSDKLTPETLWLMGRISNTSVSPDEKSVLYTISYTNIEKNNSYSDVYLATLIDGKVTQLTNTEINEVSVKWRPDGQKINFLSAESGDMQLWEMNIDGSQPKQITNIKGGISNYIYSPDLKHMLYTADVKLDEDIHDRYPDLPLANARIEDDIMYRHWDEWEDENYCHIFIANTASGMIEGEQTDIMTNEKFDSPLKPFGGIEQISWTPDSKHIAYSCKKLSGKAYAMSTNADIYMYDVEKKTTTNMTEGMMGYDLNPTFSPDGKYMAWESMERNGYEADKNRIFVLNMSSGEKKDYTVGFDQNAEALSWSAESDKIWFISNHQGTNEIYRVDINDGDIQQVTKGTHNYYSAQAAGKQLVATKSSMSYPTEIFLVNPENGEDNEISFVNKDMLAQLKLGKVESRWITTTDNKQMQTWVIYPPDFDANKKYPTLLYCQGGPQSTVSQFWSLRWNFQLMAANGYIVVAPNRRGLPGFGQEWNEQISGDYGGQNMKDYLSAIDTMAKEPFVNEDKLGAIGASYGGFSVYWLAGNHNKRFKTFVAHCGIFNFEQMYSTTEEMFFVDWDLKGAYWDKENKRAQNSYVNSPHKFVGNWDTPILVIHGEKDFRIPYTQGMGAFNTAIMRGIPARFLYFPEESHWVLSPQNGILWHREFFRWLDSYLK